MRLNAAPLRELPPVTRWLAGLFLAGWIAQAMSGHWLNLRLGLVPAFFTERLWLWQAVTYIFLHGGFWHLLGNMWAQSWENIYPLVAPPGADPGFDLTRILKSRNIAWQAELQAISDLLERKVYGEADSRITAADKSADFLLPCNRSRRICIAKRNIAPHRSDQSSDILPAAHVSEDHRRR